MRQVSFDEAAALVSRQNANGGVFLCTSDGARTNVMTIGWGGVNRFFNTPVFLAPVRASRFSDTLLKVRGTYTVSVPTSPLKQELAKAGTLSGRDGDKWTACGLTPVPAIAVDVPIVRECGLHIECEPMGTVRQAAELLPKEVLDRWYPTLDMHTFYLGKIVQCYATD